MSKNNCTLLPSPYKISYVVKDIENGKKQWEKIGLCEWVEFDYDAKQKDIMVGTEFLVKFAQAKMDNGLVLELVQPVRGNSAWQQWLDENGEGYHLMSFSTPDTWKETVEKLKANGAKIAVQANFDGLMWCYADMDLSGKQRFEITEEKA